MDTLQPWRRRAMGPAAIAVAALLAALALVACGDEEEAPAGSGPTAATTAEATTPLATPRGLPTPATTPVISGSLFEYPERGYSVRFPEGWNVLANFVAQPEIAVDAFFGPAEGEVQPNISVTCQPLPEGSTPEKFFEDKMTLVQGQATGEAETEAAQVSGVEARRAAYTVGGGEQPTLEKVEVFFIDERCGWSIALVTPADGRAQYEPLLDQFIASFTLLPAP